MTNDFRIDSERHQSSTASLPVPAPKMTLNEVSENTKPVLLKADPDTEALQSIQQELKDKLRQTEMLLESIGSKQPTQQMGFQHERREPSNEDKGQGLLGRSL